MHGSVLNRQWGRGRRPVLLEYERRNQPGFQPDVVEPGPAILDHPGRLQPQPHGGPGFLDRPGGQPTERRPGPGGPGGPVHKLGRHHRPLPADSPFYKLGPRHRPSASGSSTKSARAIVLPR